MYEGSSENSTMGSEDERGEYIRDPQYAQESTNFNKEEISSKDSKELNEEPGNIDARYDNSDSIDEENSIKEEASERNIKDREEYYSSNNSNDEMERSYSYKNEEKEYIDTHSSKRRELNKTEAMDSNQYNYANDDISHNDSMLKKSKTFDNKVESSNSKGKEIKLRAPPVIQFTNFPIFPTISTKIVTSGFAHIDTYGATDPYSTASNLPYFINQEGQAVELDISENCIIIHPGSKNLRLGFVNDPFPKEIPHIIARKYKNKPKSNNVEDISEESEEREGKIAEAINWGEKEVLDRLQSAKRKPVYNAINQVLNFNSNTQPTPLLEHNDPLREKWYHNENKADVLIGNKVLNFNDPKGEYLTRYPIKYGKLNTDNYSTLMEVKGDLETLWGKAIEEELGLEREYFEGYSVGLVIPDIYCPIYLNHAIDVILSSLGFYSVFIIQESVSASFGAGISHACIVNIGAQTTTISCVEDGACIPKSRIALPYGGDDITKLLMELLKRSNFPYPSLNIKEFSGWEIAESLKKILANYNELELAVQLYQFFVPRYNNATLKYEIKGYDEGFIAPMLLFNPSVMDLALNGKMVKLNESAPWIKGYVQQWLDGVLIKLYQGYTGPNAPKKTNAPTLNVIPSSYNDSTPVSMGAAGEDDEGTFDDEIGPIDGGGEDNDNLVGHNITDEVIGLDQAIAKSLRAASNDENTLRRLYTSIIVTGGGGALIPGFDKCLQERLFSFAPQNCNVQVLSSARDLDPRFLAWKGAAVFSKLDITQELFINFAEWQNKGVHALRDKILFSWPLPW